MTVRRPRRITSDRLLLVEGPDDRNLFEALLRRRLDDAGSAVQVVDVGGASAFKDQIRALFTAAMQAGRNLRAVGIARDADRNPAGAWQSVYNAVLAANLQPPERPAGFSDASPRVGIFIVPDSESEGSLETLCMRSVAGKPAAHCVERYLTCLEERHAMSSRNRDKSFAHAYLASRRDPVARVGEAARQGVWNFDHPTFAALDNFLRCLAGIASNP